MTERGLQVTHRKGRTSAAYLHLSHTTGEKSAWTVASPDGLLIVDHAASGDRWASRSPPRKRFLWIASTSSLRALASRPSWSRTTGPLGPRRRQLIDAITECCESCPLGLGFPPCGTR
jgi:hypothetical protein